VLELGEQVRSNKAVWTEVARQLGGIAFLGACAICVYALAFLGWSTASEFRLDPRYNLTADHSDTGALLGMGFAIAFGVAMVLIGKACSTRLASGRFVIPSWSIHLLLVLVIVFLLLLLFLNVLGGIAGPYPTPPPVQAVGQLMSVWFPLLTAFGVVLVSEGTLFIREKSSRATRPRVTFPIAVGGIGSLVILVAVALAFSLSRLS
jgi:hypothetical protein